MLERLKKFWNRSMANKEVSYQEAKKIIEKDRNTILLDVRSKQEYEEGHLLGSKNLDLYDIKKQIRKEFPDRTQTMIVYCSSGHRSREAQEILEAMGYENIYNLKGGLDNIE